MNQDLTPTPPPAPVDLGSLRQKLATSPGPQYWRSLEQLAETDEFLTYLKREYPAQAEEWTDPASRRQFLKLMGASFALAGVTGCAYNAPEKIVPYVRQPEEIVPGKPLFFATSMTLGGAAVGLLAESHEGRPTKLEGNPQHPASLGATDIYAQSAVLSLYDPNRSNAILRNGRVSTWDDFQSAMLDVYLKGRENKGRGLRILTGTVSSPFLAAQIAEILKQYPEATWHQYEPLNRDNSRAGSILAFGEDLQTHLQIDKADVIVAFDRDFMNAGPGHLRYAREFADRRDPDAAGGMNRLYVAEPSPTVTGTRADHRLPLEAGRILDALLVLAAELKVAGVPATTAKLPEKAGKWVKALAKDLADPARKGKSLVIVGHGQPPLAHAVAYAINNALGNVGPEGTMFFTQPVAAESVDQGQSIRQLVADMGAGKVETLVMLGVNPVYDAPVDLNFRRALEKVPQRVHLGLYLDETGQISHWHVPESHFLETWSDARAYDGTVSIVQPLIEPIFGGRSAHELLGSLLGVRDVEPLDLLRQFYRDRLTPAAGPKAEGDSPADFDKLWRQALHDGFIAGKVFEPKAATLKADLGAYTPAAVGDLELVFAPDPTLYDGRFAPNGWLQELPKPITKLVWDNAALISPATAQARSLKNGDVVTLTFKNRRLEAAVWILPGQADGSVTLHLGHGRETAGPVGTGTGFNAYKLRTTEAPWFGGGLEMTAAGRTYQLVTTQDQGTLEGRNLIRTTTVGAFLANPGIIADAEVGHFTLPPNRHEAMHESIYPDFEYNGYAWGMAIDLGRCIGCAACTIACQAENNIPVVGKDQVDRGRVMHWIEVDRYFEGGSIDDPGVEYQPRMCYHCERAPCEPVCPVGATVHDHEGLNNMVYNRCVGTRYCGNNCPYKVRKFNFLAYTKLYLNGTDKTPATTSLEMLYNPDVTVRTRGVMEKCTYCVQRINSARIQSQLEDRKVRDGEVVTACQSVCPTNAIVFGDINDTGSKVTQLKSSRRNYAPISELNTKPRTSYLARLRNPNPELEAV